MVQVLGACWAGSLCQELSCALSPHENSRHLVNSPAHPAGLSIHWHKPKTLDHVCFSLCRYPHIGWPASSGLEPLPGTSSRASCVWPLLTCHLLREAFLTTPARVTFSLSLVFFLHVFIKLCVYLRLVCLPCCKLNGSHKNRFVRCGCGEQCRKCTRCSVCIFWMNEWSSWSPRLILLITPFY